jgi:prepilin-type N-terminal cleavage/methylation domain-containing protein
MKTKNSVFCTSHYVFRAGFTLIELLAVITIIAVLAGIVIPNLSAFKPNASASAERQLLDALGRARQLAISQRTTVYLVFLSTNFWTNSGYARLTSYPLEANKTSKLLGKQLIGYNIVALRSLGDQPGQNTPRYFGPWQALPEGSIIPAAKFQERNPLLPVMTITNSPVPYNIYGFLFTNAIPFPSEKAAALANVAPYVPLPYVAFNYQGQLADGTGAATGVDEFIPIAKGAVSFARNSDHTFLTNNPTVTEQPAGNSTNSFDLVRVDWLTGRSHIERLEVR